MTIQVSKAPLAQTEDKDIRALLAEILEELRALRDITERWMD